MIEHEFNGKTFNEISEIVRSEKRNYVYVKTAMEIGETVGKKTSTSYTNYCRIDDLDNKISYLFIVDSNDEYYCCSKEGFQNQTEYSEMKKF